MIRVNMLRTSTESMSVVLSGVDILTAWAFDITFESPPDLERLPAISKSSERRSYFDKVMDPAAGFTIENLTSSWGEC
jgi:methylmalonyl-CoA mutase N-terminal domain/subunit